MPNDRWTFFHAFLRAPRVVASCIPSSGHVVRRVLAAADVADAEVVVELGPGTGGTTRALLSALGPRATLLAIERTPELARHLSSIGDPRLVVVEGCASSLASELSDRGLPSADAVVSGIPFSTMPPAVAEAVVVGIDEALRPGGRFVAYQFTDRVADYTQPVLGTPRVERELLNAPPLRVFSWRKSETAEASGTLRRTA